MYQFLDYALAIFHDGLILFNLIGWAYYKTARLHLITMSAAMLSWFIAGIFYGWGYCLLTDWHWQIKAKLGETDIPRSYVKYYLDKWTGFDLDPGVLAAVVVTLGITVFILSIQANLRYKYKST